MVTFMRDSSDKFQLSESPLTNPETITNISTSTFTAVKILLTQADSFTPKERRPVKEIQRHIELNYENHKLRDFLRLRYSMLSILYHRDLQ